MDEIIKDEKKLGRPPKEEKVVISRDELNKMQEDIRILKSVASRYKLEEQEALANKGKKKESRGFLKKLDGKLIVKWIGSNEPGWKGEQKILYQGTTPIGEVLVSHFKTIEDEDVICDAVKFYRSTDLEHFTKVGQEGDIWIIRFDNPELPQEFKVDVKFINP